MKYSLFLILFLDSLFTIAQSTVLEENNSRIYIQHTGRFLANSSSGDGAYEIPKTNDVQKKSTLFTSGLWIGAKTKDSVEHLSAMTYRQRGPDFWPGPISDTLNTAKYNKIYKVTQQDVEDHKSGNRSTADLLTWPGNGDTTKGEPWKLAPFYDLNNNTAYEPHLGEYPRFPGVSAAYCVFNDASIHQNSGGKPLNVDVHQLIYQTAFSMGGIIVDDVNLVRFTLVNRGTDTLTDVQLGIFNDFDLGNSADDYIGCDTRISLAYIYNGLSSDAGTNGYGSTPPAFGIAMLSRPMASSIYFKNSSNTVNGNPSNWKDYHNYLNAKWRTGHHLRFGGNGITGSSEVASFMYPSYTDPNFPDNDWNEKKEGNTPGDRRFLSTFEKTTLAPGKYESFDFAYIYARALEGDNEASISTLKVKTRMIRSAYFNNLFGWKENNSLGGEQGEMLNTTNPVPSDNIIYPNPSTGHYSLEGNLANEGGVVINSLGQTIQSVAPHARLLDLSNQPSGVYYFRAGGNTIQLIKL
jgi:hypothetical protein